MGVLLCQGVASAVSEGRLLTASPVAAEARIVCQLNTAEWPYAIFHYPTEFVLSPTFGSQWKGKEQGRYEWCLDLLVRRMILKPEAGVDAT